jgi:hypothetical protein
VFWENFEILTAFKPDITDITPKRLRIEEDGTFTVTITGSGFTEGAEPVLRSQQGHKISPESVSIDPSGRSMKLTFANGQLGTGQYMVYIKNPGGLEASQGPLRMVMRRGLPLVITVSTGYAPLLPLYGSLFEFIGGSFLPIGVYARLGVLPLNKPWGSLGAELEPFWNYADVAQGDYEVFFHLIGAHVNLLFSRRLLSNILAVNLRLGTGITSVTDFHLQYAAGSTDSFLGYYFSAEGSASLQWFIYKSFFAEAGALYNHVLTANDPQLGSFRFTIGLGWQF